MTTPKVWTNTSATSLNAAALIDMETRLSNVIEFDLGPPNGTDDTATLQSAIAAASATGAGRIKPRAGTYIISSATLAANMAIAAPPGCIFQHKAGTTNPLLYWPQSPRTVLSNVHLTGLHFLGETNPLTEDIRAGIYIVYGEDIHVEDCDVQGFKSAGIHVQDSMRVWVEGNRVKNCGTLNGRNSLEVMGTDGGLTSPDTTTASGFWYVNDNHVSGSPSAGIGLVPKDAQHPRAVCRGNTVTDCTGWTAIVCESGFASDIIVANNLIRNSLNGIVWIDTANTHGSTVVTKQNVLSGNNIDAVSLAGAVGIDCQSQSIAITGNTVRSTDSCLKLRTNSTTGVIAQQATINGNTLIEANANSGSTPFPLFVSGVKTVAITGNVVTCETQYSNDTLYIDTVDYYTVTGNVLKGAGRDGIRLTTTTNGAIGFNTIIDPNTNSAAGVGININGVANADVRIAENTIKDTRGGSALMVYGISNGGGSRIIEENNSISGYVTGAVNGSSHILRNNFSQETTPASTGLAGSRVAYASAAPSSGSWTTGDVTWNTAPTAAGNIGWVCTASGSPGTWKTFGTIAA